MKHTERAERKRTTGIEPEFYVEAPEPPAPVENSGIGQSRYYGQRDPFVGPLTGCRECGAMIYNTLSHDRWHTNLVA